MTTIDAIASSDTQEARAALLRRIDAKYGGHEANYPERCVRDFASVLNDHVVLIKEDYISDSADGTADPTTMLSAYTTDGAYVGTADEARRLFDRYGIAPELSKPEHNTCSIGWSQRTERWYGWSHRAICGFGIGHTVKEGDVVTSEADEGDIPAIPAGFTCVTLEDCRRLAEKFAAEVS